MSAFPGSQTAYETLTGPVGNFTYAGQAKMWRPDLVSLPEVDTSQQAMDAARENTQKTLGVQQQWRGINARQQSWRQEQNKKATESMRSQSTPKVNTAPTMDAWRERRSQVGQLKKSAEADRKAAMEKALAMQRGPERMRAISEANKPRIWT